jgi:hypothetical protein
MLAKGIGFLPSTPVHGSSDGKQNYDCEQIFV